MNAGAYPLRKSIMKLAKKELITQAWALTKKHYFSLLGTVALVFVISGVLNGLQSELEKESTILGFVLGLAVFVVSALLQLGIARVALRVADGEEPALEQLFADAHRLLPMIGATIIYTVVIIVGFLLLIVPGVIWAIRYSQYPYVLLDGRTGALASLSESARLTKGRVWQLFLLGLLMVLINIAGLLLLVVGLFVTVPLTVVLGGIVFRVLSPKESVPSAEPTTEVVPEPTGPTEEPTIAA